MTFPRRLAPLLTAVLLLALVLRPPGVQAQTPAEVQLLRGLAAVSTLGQSAAGKAALAANLAVTAAIQDGRAHQPALLPFGREQQQSLRDAFITGGNAANLADGLGSTLAPLYAAAARYSADDGDAEKATFTSVSPAVADVLGYAYGTTHADAGLAKFFFGDGTLDGSQPASAEALAVFTAGHGTPDVFGKAYGMPPGGPPGTRGNPRPFITRGHYLAFWGPDYFGQPSSNTVYLRGPAEDNTGSPSFPSGHTVYGYTEALVLALLVPERYPQLVARAAEYGNERIVLGAHYAMDVLGARTLAEHDLAQLLAGTAGYTGVPRGRRKIDDFRAALEAARADLAQVFSTCGGTVSACAQHDSGRFASGPRDESFYEATQTYGLPAVYPQNAAPEDIAKLAPEAGNLLTAAFPYLSLAQADAILTATEGPGGGFLDDGSSFGVYSRLDLYRAAKAAQAAAPKAAGPAAPGH